MFLNVSFSMFLKFELDFFDNICRVYTVWAKSKTLESHNFLKRMFSVELKKDFISQVHLYFSASFAFFFKFPIHNVKLER